MVLGKKTRKLFRVGIDSYSLRPLNLDPFAFQTGRPVDIFKVNRRAAEQAQVLGITAVRSCSGGLMRWTDDSPPTGILLQAMAQSLRAQKGMLDGLGVTLAIETHFEF